MKIKQVLLFLLAVLISLRIVAQDDTDVVKAFFDEALQDQSSFNKLEYLCKKCNGRLTGSPQAAAAVEFTYHLLKNMALDSVFKQPVKVPRWVRGEKELAYVNSKVSGFKEVAVTAIGMSVATGKDGLRAEVVEVKSFEQLKELGRDKIEGRIVFFNRPMDPTNISTFSAYAAAANQRTQGASKAAEFGAVGVVVRSLTTSLDDFPHTGVLMYDKNQPKIPAVAISTKGANLLSRWMEYDPHLTFYFKTTCKTLPEVISHNVIGELKGSVYPDEIITVGGHLDTWDLGEGAHDDGAGCMQSIDVLRLFKTLGIRPKRTIRAVMFMDEEVGQRGGKEYAKQAKLNNEKHYFALEADRGALVPRGFGISTTEEKLEKILELKKYFEPYGITNFRKGGGGVDISPLREFGTPLSSFITDEQRYFDFHHSGNDTFEQVNLREFQMGSAAMAAFIYLIDNYDL